MPEPIPGHEVLRMMLESGKRYTKASLREEILRRFGPNYGGLDCAVMEGKRVGGREIDQGDGGSRPKDEPQSNPWFKFVRTP
jgi:hypothetical protein